MPPGLLSFLAMGRDRSNLMAHLRSFPMKKHIIFYRPTNETVEIVRALFGSRDIDAIFRADAGSAEDGKEV